MAKERIILSRNKEGEYEISITSKNSSCCFSRVRLSKGPAIQGDYIIETYRLPDVGEGDSEYADWNNHEDNAEKIGVAHGKKDIQRQLYLCAKKEARKQAKTFNGQFVDKTKPSRLENISRS